MLRLKDRNKSIPNGFQFYLPELKWSAPKNYPSFTTVCQQLTAVIRANAFLAQQHKWPTDPAGIADWVDTYNATVCAKMGWDDYIMTGGGGSFPKSQPPPHNVQKLAAAAAAARKLVAGAKTLIGWLDSGEPEVARDLAERRAFSCLRCPHNNKGNLTDWFTVPVSELIRRQVSKLQSRHISTIHDENLHVCDVCLCPLKLKVQTPMKWILKEIPANVLQELKDVPGCWVKDEEK